MLNSMFGRVVFMIALLLIVWIQSQLWLGEGSIGHNRELQGEIDARKAENAVLAERNRILMAEVRDLKQGLEAVEERARLDLGMVKNGETFVRVTKSRPVVSSAPPAGGAAR